MTYKPFEAYRYDDYFVLKVTFSLWIIMLWSVHHILLLSMGAFSHSGNVFSAIVAYASAIPLLLSDIPGALILFARFNRTPKAGARVRGIWRNGKLLLIVGLSMSAGATLVLRGAELTDLESSTPWVLAINTVFVLYLATSKTVKEIFADFPSPDVEEKTGNKAIAN